MTSNVHVPASCDSASKNAYSAMVFPTGNDDPETDSAPASCWLPKLSNATGSSQSTVKPLEPGATIRRMSLGHPNMVSGPCNSTLIVSVSDHKEKGFIWFRGAVKKIKIKIYTNCNVYKTYTCKYLEHDCVFQKSTIVSCVDQIIGQYIMYHHSPSICRI